MLAAGGRVLNSENTADFLLGFGLHAVQRCDAIDRFMAQRANEALARKKFFHWGTSVVSAR